MAGRWDNLVAWGKANGYPLSLERSQALEACATAPFGTDCYNAWMALPAEVRAEHVDFMTGMRALFAPVNTGESLRGGC